MVKTDIYKVTIDLEEKGWMYDDSGVYIPYTHKNNDYHDNRKIFLKLERKSSKIRYTFVKLEDELFYPISTSYISKVLINEYDENLIKRLSSRGVYSSLNTKHGIFIEFVTKFKDKILNADCLDVLKNRDFTISKEEDMVNLTVNKRNNKHHNLMPMQNLVMQVTGQLPEEFGEIHHTHVNPFTNEGTVKVFQSVLRCLTSKKQYDQTEFLMEYFNLNTAQEAENKFQELLHNSKH